MNGICKTDEQLYCDWALDFEGMTYFVRAIWVASFFYKKPDFSTWDSDWDYRGGLDFFEVDMTYSLVFNKPINQESSLLNTLRFDDLPWFVKESFMEDLHNHALQFVKRKYNIC